MNPIIGEGIGHLPFLSGLYDVFSLSLQWFYDRIIMLNNIVTAYVPSLDKWEEGFKVRRKRLLNACFVMFLMKKVWYSDFVLRIM
ncbi:MAG: hypothetical protein IT393_04655 [Nitrospirae bacterium]|nr:hypothetical protein [Nitrospirota bacterium]